MGSGPGRGGRSSAGGRCGGSGDAAEWPTVAHRSPQRGSLGGAMATLPLGCPARAAAGKVAGQGRGRCGGSGDAAEWPTVAQSSPQRGSLGGAMATPSAALRGSLSETWQVRGGGGAVAGPGSAAALALQSQALGAR